MNSKENVKASSSEHLGSFGQRLEAAREHFGESKSSLARKLDISRTTYYDWTDLHESKKHAVGVMSLVFPELSVQWLNTGEGEMLHPTGDSTGGKLPASPGSEVASTRNLFLVKGDTYPENDERTAITIFSDYDVQAGAGDGGFVCEGVEENAREVQLAKQLIHDLLGFWPPDDMEMMRVGGHSMEPLIHKGQLVLYKPIRRVEQMINLRTYLIEVEDAATDTWTPLVKRIHRRPGGGFRIISDNKGAGEPDVVIVPNDSAGHYERKDEPGRPFNMCVTGEVLHPSGQTSNQQRQIISQTLETLAREGTLQGV